MLQIYLNYGIIVYILEEKMYKFFVSSDQIQNNHVKILGEDVKHISNVLRLQPLEKLTICDKDVNKSYVAEINNINKEYVECTIVNEIKETTESNVNIDLYQGLPKSDKMEYIIQKTIEIGVGNIYPVTFERCVVKLDKKTEEKKLERWKKIAEAAAKQSKRDVISNIENVINIENICQNIKKYDIILLAYENEQNNTLKYELQKLDRDKKLSIGVIIGPEGGLSEKEVEKLIIAGAKCVSLGKRILRTETASLVMLSDIIYEFEL